MANILLMDDEPLVLEALSSAIQSQGHKVVTASNGVEGLKKFAERQFDLVITDIIMPKEGIETILEMRRHRPNAKIIAISGGGRTGNVEFLEMAESLGAVASLKKPIKLAELFAVLSECLGDGLGATPRKRQGSA